MTVTPHVLTLPVERWNSSEAVGTLCLPHPPGWRYRHDVADLMHAFDHPLTGLRVIVSAIREQDDQDWLHVSVSRCDRLPTYHDLKLVKHHFIGPDQKAIQVFPPESEYVSIHPYVLHLWHCLTGDPLPDFTRGNGII